MIFSEAVYPLFLVITVAAFHVMPKRWRPWWLFATGCVFYAYYAHVFLWLLLVEIALIYVLGRKVRSSRWAFGGALALALGVLFYFKYRNMALTGIGELLSLFGGRGFPEFEQIVLPLAISFFTFEFIHYLVDSRQDKIADHPIQDFLAYAMFFPTMVAGPIKRFQDFSNKLEAARFSYEDMSAGMTRILYGFAKKIVIADTMDLWVQPLKSNAGVAGASSWTLLVALVAYSIKIYMDFSGYSDIAIGSARLFGIKVPENFDWPYIRTDIASSWRHWHMSLTSWITDYIYIPLGGSRHRLWAVVALNTMIAMSASGLWHGADWHFVAWGVYHGVLLVCYRLYRDKLRPVLSRAAGAREGGSNDSWLPSPLRPLGTAASVALTFSLVTLGWGLFVMPVGRFAALMAKIVAMKG